jgi:hypothetical protein
MTSRMFCAVLAAAAISMVAAPAAVAAANTVEATVSEPTRADELRAEAETYFSQPRQWRRAARLLERSAALRSADDAEAYSCLILAASLRVAVGEYGAAQQLYRRAAEHASARGAVMDAAHAFIDAAHAAAQARSGDDVTDLMARARLLASSPLLSADQAGQITGRLLT